MSNNDDMDDTSNLHIDSSPTASVPLESGQLTPLSSLFEVDIFATPLPATRARANRLATAEVTALLQEEDGAKLVAKKLAATTFALSVEATKRNNLMRTMDGSALHEFMSELDDLKAKEKESEAKYQKLFDEHAELQEKYNAIQQTNQDLKNQVSNLQRTVSSIQAVLTPEVLAKLSNL